MNTKHNPKENLSEQLAPLGAIILLITIILTLAHFGV